MNDINGFVMNANKHPIVIVGAGGHAKVILSILSALHENIIGLVDDDIARHHTTLLGSQVIGDLSFLTHWTGRAVCALGHNSLRRAITLHYDHLTWVSAIHPRAYVHESVSLGDGSIVCAGAIIQPDVIIGKQVIINTAVSIDHDCQIGDYSHIAPGSHLGGGIEVGEGALIGLGSNIKPYTVVGPWSIIGAGSVVVHDIEGHVVAKGVPAKSYKVIRSR